MSIGTGTHFENPVLGSKDVYEDVPVDILSRTQRATIFTDFNEPTENSTTGAWVSTAVTAVTTSAVVASAPNGIYRITNTVDAQGCGSLQMIGSTAALYAPAQAWLTPSLTAAVDGGLHRTISFGARVSINPFNISDWFIGLAGIDSTLLLATGLLATTGFDNGAGFHHMVHANPQGGLTGPDGNDVRFAAAGAAVANYQAVLSSSTNALVRVPTPAAASVDGIFFEYGIRIVGTSRVDFFINRRMRHRMLLTNALASTLVPSFALISNGNACTMDIDYVWASQTR